MKIKLESVKIVLKKIFYYFVFIISFVLTYYLGFFSKKMQMFNESKPPYTTIYKKNVTLAMDEYDNLLIIDKLTGNYVLYEDSVGKSIFIMYANKVSTAP
jgi:hypothetical protein